MLGYRITINNDTSGNLTWSLLFDSDNSKYGNAETEHIFSVAHEFVSALANLQQEGTMTPARR